MAEPLIVYLDTQDYSNLYDIKTDEMQTTFNYLCEKVDKGEIIIPYSYYIIAEFLTAFTDEFKEDRLMRIDVINRLCGNNSFKFINSDMSFENALSKGGCWYPEFDMWKNIKNGIEEQAIQLISSLPKNLSKTINKKNPWPRLFRIFPEFAKSISQSARKLPVPKSFYETDLLVKYLKGKISERTIKAESEKILTDLNIFFSFWFDNELNKNVKFLHELIQTAGNPFLKSTKDLIAISMKANEGLEYIQEVSTTNHSWPEELKQELRNTKMLLNEFKKPDLDFIKTSIPNKSVLEKFPDHFIDTILLYAIGNVKLNRKVQDSDAGDLMHAFYLPYCDIWRGDVSFCNLLVDQKVDGHEKIVNRLLLLPTAIESKLKLNNFPLDNPDLRS